MISYKANKNISNQDSITSIWLSKNPVKIKQHCYFEIVNEDSIHNIMLNGYLRKENGKILIYPRVAEEESIDSLKRDYTLIDFKSKVGDTWNISYSTDGYYYRKLKLVQIKYDKLLNDSTFLITIQNISPRSFVRPSHTEEEKMMVIGRKKGLIVFGVQSYMNVDWYFLKGR